MRSSVFPNDDQVDVNLGIEIELGDLLDGAGVAVNVKHAFVDAHLEAIVRVGTITARRAACSHGQHLGGDADGTASLVLKSTGTVDNLGANGLEMLDLARAEGKADTLDVFLYFLLVGLVLFGVHFC